MSDAARVKVYDSLGPDYHRAFQTFLDHTDQKARAREWLEQLVAALPARRLFIDAGAGTGAVTAWMARHFTRAIAFEPNGSLRGQLQGACPAVEVRSETIAEAQLPAEADLVLCSHVFYYLPQEEWLSSLEQLASWLDASGVAVVALQNAESDCMRMVRQLLGRRFDLAALGTTFGERHRKEYAVGVETVPAYITAPDFDTAYTVAEFVLNTVSMPGPPPRADLEAYVRRHFATNGTGFRFSCSQDFLSVRRQHGG